MATFLNKLNVIPLTKREPKSAVDQRRAKLIQKLEEQMALAAAQVEGKRYIVMKNAWTRDDAGTKTKVQREKIVRPWWFADGDHLSMVIKYGSRPLELSKGKRALSIGDLPGVPETIKVVIAAVQNGELDQAMEMAIAAGKPKAAKK